MPHPLKHAFAAALAVTVTLTGALRTDAAPTVSHFKLANGLEVVVIPDHRTPVVTHMLWYRVGAADETAGKTGLAHFLEHLMFKGTEKNPQGLFSQTVSNIGGQENAFTSSEYTGYFQRTAREHLKMLMEFESDRMTGLALTDDVVKPELQVVLEEQNMRVANRAPACRSRWRRRSFSTIPTSGRSSAGGRRSRNSHVTTRSRSTSASIRPTTQS
jgi:zinc protease